MKRKEEKCAKKPKRTVKKNHYNKEEVAKKLRDSSNMGSNLEMLGDETVKDISRGIIRGTMDRKWKIHI